VKIRAKSIKIQGNLAKICENLRKIPENLGNSLKIRAKMASNVFWFENKWRQTCFALGNWRPICSSWENIRTKSDPKIFRASLGKFGQKSFTPPNICLLVHSYDTLL